MVCPDIAFQLTDNLVFPAHTVRSFLFFAIVAFPISVVNPGIAGMGRQPMRYEHRQSTFAS